MNNIQSHRSGTIPRTLVGTHDANNQRRLHVPRWLWIVWIGIALLSTAAYGLKLRSQHPAIDETTALVNKLSMVIQLPNERPVLATVSNKDALVGNPFSGQVQNGDKIIIYLQAKRSLLYRPSTGKIIDIAPIQSNPTFTVPPTR